MSHAIRFPLSPLVSAGPCAKQYVKATIVAANGERFVGFNGVRNPQPVCPRGDMPSGTGYELCRDVCDQVGHAEVNALRLAGEMAEGATLYLEGHTYACRDCQGAMNAAGIAQLVVGAPPSTEAA